MKEKHTGKTSAKRGATDWERMRALSDKDIRAAVQADPEACSAGCGDRRAIRRGSTPFCGPTWRHRSHEWWSTGAGYSR